MITHENVAAALPAATCPHIRLDVLHNGSSTIDDYTGDEYVMVRCQRCEAYLVARITKRGESVTVRPMNDVEEAHARSGRWSDRWCA